MSYQEELRALALLRSQRSQGALQRINSLVEPQSFVELEAFCGEEASGEGLRAGYAVIDGRSVFIYAHEHDVLKGALGMNQARKLARLIDKAVSTGAPIIGIINSNGALLNEGLDAAEGYGLIIKAASKASGKVPHIVILDGPAAGATALYAACADFVIVKKDASLSASPAGSVKADANAALASGAAALYAEDEVQAASLVRGLLGFLPDNAHSPAETLYYDDINRLCPELEEMAEQGSLDGRKIISSIADNGVFMELYKETAQDHIAGFISLDGLSAGVIACFGRISEMGARKAKWLVNFCGAYNMPVVVLADSEGFVVSSEAEKNGLLSQAGGLAMALASHPAPVISVICGSAIGSAYITLAAKGCADLVYAWAGAAIGLMTPKAQIAMHSEALKDSQDPLQDRKKLEEQFALEHMSAIEAAKGGYIDQPIEPGYTRMHIIGALNALSGKRGISPFERACVPRF